LTEVGCGGLLFCIVLAIGGFSTAFDLLVQGETGAAYAGFIISGLAALAVIVQAWEILSDIVRSWKSGH